MIGQLGGAHARGQANLGKKGPKYDTSPYIHAAGKLTSDSETAKVCFEPELQGPRPITPPEIKKYRKSTIHEPGVVNLHYGLADDPIPGAAEGMAYGSKVIGSEKVAQVIATYPQNEMMLWKRERQEEIYASAAREPLGRSMLRGHELPVGLATGAEPFGVEVGAVYKSKNPESKILIYPVDMPAEDDPDGTIHARYVKTHGEFAPGEQRRRNYDWEAAGLDPADHAFGIHEAAPYRQGVAKAVNPSLDLEAPPPVTVVEKRLETFRMTNADELGRCKDLGHGQTVPAGHTFGVPSRRFEEHGVRRLIKGSYDAAEQAPDPDLGKSLRPGCRNDDGGCGRSFGTPTIRTDIPGPAVKSVADNQNYGNEPGAAALLYPHAASAKGVREEDYLKPCSEADIASLYKDALGGIDPAELSAIYAQAAGLDQLPGGKCCLHTFMRCKAAAIHQTALKAAGI